MSKITLTDLVNLQNETTTVNALNKDNAVLKTAMDNTLSRDGESPNEMEATLDMNSHRILNLPKPISLLEPIRLTDLNTFSGGPILIDPLPTGGLTGQTLQKNSDTNYDVSWTNGSKATRGFTSVKDYGAKGDAVNLSTPLIISSGSSLLTATGASFTLADVGKTILVRGAGPTGSDLVTTILAFNTTNNVTLAAVASTTLSSTGVITYGTDDTAAINAAKTASLNVFWPAGNYIITSTIDLSTNNTKHSSLGGVTMYFFGSNTAFTFDGGDTIGYLQGVTFGSREYPFTIVGTSNATDLIFARSFLHSNLNIIASECRNALLLKFAVLSSFYVECSTNTSGTMHTKPQAAIITDQRGAGEKPSFCDFEIIAEGLSGTGLQLQNVQYCSFTGTSEGNISGGGGVYEGSGCNNNIFRNFDCESNAGTDWLLDGSRDTLLENCSGNSTTASLILNGTYRTRVTGGIYFVITVIVTSTNCYFEYVNYSTLNNNSTTTTYIRLFNLSGAFILPDNRIKPTVSTPGFSAGWTNFGGGYRLAGYWQTPDGIVHLTGVTAGGSPGSNIFQLPAGMRPSANLAFNYVELVGPGQGLLGINNIGLVNHLSGVTTAVSLDGITFLAEQ